MEDVETAAGKILSFYLLSGKPYASVKVDEIAFEEGGVSVIFSVEEGPYVTVREVVFTGSHSTSESFLLLETGLPKTEFLFNSEKILEAVEKLDGLGYIVTDGRPYLETRGRIEYASLVIPIKTRRSNSVSGSFFYLAETETTGGKVNALIKNIAGRGHSLSVNWEKPDEKKTLWSFALKTYWLFSKPIDADIYLSVRREEFSDRLSGQAKFTYNLGSFGVFTGAEYVEFSSTAYRYETYRNVSGAFFDRIDYPRNPVYGFAALLEIKNGRLHSQNRNFYDFTCLFSAELFLPRQPFTFRVFSETQAVMTDADILDLKILYGGEKGPRGFLKESISAGKGSLLILEPRFITGKNGHLFTFFDCLIFENIQQETKNENSFGAGFSAGTGDASLKLYIAGNPHMKNYKDAIFYADVIYEF